MQIFQTKEKNLIIGIYNPQDVQDLIFQDFFAKLSKAAGKKIPPETKYFQETLKDDVEDMANVGDMFITTTIEDADFYQNPGETQAVLRTNADTVSNFESEIELN